MCVSVCQVNSEDECEDCSKDNLDQMCVDAREQLTNSIRLQWRRLKNRMHTLDTQGLLKPIMLNSCGVVQREESRL